MNDIPVERENVFRPFGKFCVADGEDPEIRSYVDTTRDLNDDVLDDQSWFLFPGPRPPLPASKKKTLAAVESLEDVLLRSGL